MKIMFLINYNVTKILVVLTFMKILQIIIKNNNRLLCEYEDGRQRHEVPIVKTTVQPKSLEDFTSGIETRPGVTPPLWPPYQYK
jgi:hypothetical protein